MTTIKAEKDGTLLMSGAATVFDDMLCEAAGKRLPGTGAPTVVLYKNCEVLGFTDEAVLANEKRVYFEVQLSHRVKAGSNVVIHVHWVPEDNTGGNVAWRLTVSQATIGGTFPTETPYDVVGAAGTTTDAHLVTDLATLTAGGISEVYLCCLRRFSSDASDTYNGKTAYVLYVDAHIEMDTLGSRQITTK